MPDRKCLPSSRKLRPVDRSNWITYAYGSGRDGLLELKNEVKLRPVTNTNTAVNSFLSSKHGDGLNPLGQRTSHAETLERQGNFGYDYRSRRVRREVDFWAGGSGSSTWIPLTRNYFVYHGWSRGEGPEPRQTIRRIAPQGLLRRAEARQSTFLALNVHKDFSFATGDQNKMTDTL